MEVFPNRAALIEVLQRCKKVNALVLKLPYQFSPTFLANGTVIMKHLRTLETDVSHVILSSFLHHHKHIQNVTLLSVCDFPASCPLRNVDCPRLVDIRSPLACAPSFRTGTKPTTFVAHYMGEDDVFVPATSIFQTLAAGNIGVYLSRISIDFGPGDQSILRRIAAAAPAVKYLKLVERSTATIVSLATTTV